MGGKSRLAKEVINNFPDDYKLYVEPFFGAGNIFFRIPDDKMTKPNVINDLDEDIYIIMKGLKENGDYINKNIKRNNYTREYFNSIKDKKDPLSVLERYKVSFRANGRSYYFSKTKPIRTDFSKFSDKLKDTIILNQSFEKVIKKYDGKDTFFYLDPPYEMINNRKDYKHYITPNDVYNAIRKIKGKFLLSYNDSPNIRKLFKDYKIKEVQTAYLPLKVSNLKYRKVIELLISNY